MLSLKDIINTFSGLSKTPQSKSKRYNHLIKKIKLNIVRKGMLIELIVSVPFLMLNKKDCIRPPPVYQYFKHYAV